MSVRPVTIRADGSVDVIHDDAPDGPHGGTIPAAQVSFAAMVGGGHDHRYVPLSCPVCPSVSLHPIGGGTAEAATHVQELFVRLAVRVGCPCGQLAAGRPVPIVQAHIKLQTERMDPGRGWLAGTLH